LNFVFWVVCSCLIYEVIACLKRQIYVPMYSVLEQYWQFTGSLVNFYLFFIPSILVFRLFAFMTFVELACLKQQVYVLTYSFSSESINVTDDYISIFDCLRNQSVTDSL